MTTTKAIYCYEDIKNQWHDSDRWNHNKPIENIAFSVHHFGKPSAKKQSEKDIKITPFSEIDDIGPKKCRPVYVHSISASPSSRQPCLSANLRHAPIYPTFRLQIGPNMDQIQNVRPETNSLGSRLEDRGAHSSLRGNLGKFRIRVVQELCHLFPSWNRALCRQFQEIAELLREILLSVVDKDGIQIFSWAA